MTVEAAPEFAEPVPIIARVIPDNNAAQTLTPIPLNITKCPWL